MNLQAIKRWLDCGQRLDFIAPLLLRLYLVPVFWMAGTHKLADMDSVIAWFGNPDWGLGLPFPTLMAWLAALTETGGAILLLLGLGVRLISIPLIITMLVAMFAVHWEFGWQAIADPAAPFATERVMEAADKLARAREILQQYGHYDWLTSSGRFAIINNGIEFAATYLVMLVVLLFHGGGRWVALDYWLCRLCKARS